MALTNEDIARNIKRDNAYNEINNDVGSDKFDIDLPLYLVNSLNQNGFKTNGDLGFYIDLCQGKTKEEIDEYLTSLKNAEALLNEQKKAKEDLNSNKTISKDMLKAVNSINDIVQIMSSSSGAYNPYKDVTGITGNTDFTNDINELRRHLNTSAFDPKVKNDIALREKRIARLKTEIAKERAEIKNLSATADNLDEITRRAANFNRLAQSYHNAARSLEKRKDLLRAEKGLLSHESINKALSLVDKIYNSLNYASLNGYNNPKIKELNKAFAKLKNTLNNQRNYLTDDKEIDANIAKATNDLNTLADKLKIEITNAASYSESKKNVNIPASTEETLKEEFTTPKETSKTFKERKDRYNVGDKVTFVGIEESDNASYYNNLNLFDFYTIAQIDEDGYTFKEVAGKYRKENFASEDDFKHNYRPGKDVYLYINKEDADLVPNELTFNKPYKIKNIYGNKLEFFGLKDTYPINTFIPLKTWNKVGVDLTGLMPSHNDFNTKFNEAYGLNSTAKATDNKYEGLVYVGLLKNLSVSYIPGLSFGSLYNTKSVSGKTDKIAIKDLDGEYNKDAFMTPLEFNKTYLAGMQEGNEIIFTPKLSQTYDAKLVPERIYTLEKYDQTNKTVKLAGVDGEFDAKSFFPCYWQYLTGKVVKPVATEEPAKKEKLNEELKPGVKVIYHGVSKSNELGIYTKLSMLGSYTIKKIDGNNLEFEEVEGSYPKEYFYTSKEFYDDLVYNKKRYYYPSSYSSKFNENLSLTTPYTIRTINNGKYTFNEIEGEYDEKDFLLPKDWVRAANALTGLSVNDKNFETVLKSKLNSFKTEYVVYNGNKVEGFDLCYADLEVGKKYEVIKETASTYTINTGKDTQIISKSSFDTLEKWEKKENSFVYIGKITRDVSVSEFNKLKSGKAYKANRNEDGFISLEGFDVSYPKKCFMPYEEWTKLTEEEQKSIIEKNTPHKEISRHVVKTTAYTASAASAVFGLILMLINSKTTVAIGTVTLLISAIAASVGYSIDKLAKKGKKKESLKIKQMINDGYKSIKEKINAFKAKYLSDDEELEGTIDEVFNSLDGEEVEETKETAKEAEINEEKERVITK